MAVSSPSSPILRPLEMRDLAEATRLCLRSKAYWGYDAEFIARCEAELTLLPDDVGKGNAMVADRGALVGIVQVERDTGRSCSLEKLFVDPDNMGTGLGRQLFAWGVSRAHTLGAREMVVEADPGAVPFYLKMGCTEAGSVPSGSIPGRSLPRLVYSLG